MREASGHCPINYCYNSKLLKEKGIPYSLFAWLYQQLHHVPMRLYYPNISRMQLLASHNLRPSIFYYLSYFYSLIILINIHLISVNQCSGNLYATKHLVTLNYTSRYWRVILDHTLMILHHPSLLFMNVKMCGWWCRLWHAYVTADHLV